MSRPVFYLTILVTGVIASISLAQYESEDPFDWRCYYDPDRLPQTPLTRQDYDTINALVIFARGWGDCWNQGNDPLPAWANRIVNPNDPESLTRFYDDNSHGHIFTRRHVSSHAPNRTLSDR